MTPYPYTDGLHGLSFSFSDSSCLYKDQRCRRLSQVKKKGEIFHNVNPAHAFSSPQIGQTQPWKLKFRMSGTWHAARRSLLQNPELLAI